MPKTKKNKKKENIETDEYFDEKSLKDLLSTEIAQATEGLYYISETDAEILPFVGSQADVVSKEEILKQTQKSADLNVEERGFTEFFERLTKVQDWFGEEETEKARKFTGLKNLLEQNLRDLKVFKVGSIELEVYAVGLDSENILKGIKTKAVET